MNKAYYRRYIEKLIGFNPSSFVITRTTTQDDGYGGTITETVVLPAQQGRFYNKRMPASLITDGGIVYSQSTALKLLVLDTVDIAKGDLLQYGGQTLRVAFLAVYSDICKQAEMEVVA